MHKSENSSAESYEVVVSWVENASDGTASGQHLKGTLARLQAINTVRIIAVIADRRYKVASFRQRAGRILWTNIQTASKARPGRILIARYHPALLPAVLAWRISGAKVILSVQGSIDEFSSSKNPFIASRAFSTLASLAPRLSNGLISGAPVLDRQISTRLLNPGAAFESIPNGVFVDDLREAKQTESPMPEKQYAVYVGNLARWQGINYLVKAAEDPQWPKQLQLVVVGDGEDRELVTDHPNIRWVGAVSSSEAARWLAHSYCALSLKRTDTQMGSLGYYPFKLIESAATGIPIVSSRAPGIQEFSEIMGHVVLVPGQDASAAASAVHRLWTDRTYRDELATRGMRNVTHLDWSAGAPSLANIIARVAAM